MKPIQLPFLLTCIATLSMGATAAAAEVPQFASSVLMAAPASPVLPQEKKKRAHLAHFNLGKKNLAIQGYDPVAYFPEGGGKPQKGNKSLSYTHLEVTYRFASQKNLDLFKKDPSKFEPAYGGWCAYAMADNDKTGINPKSFLIQDGKLLLFYDGFWGDTRKLWQKDSKGLSPKADAGWQKFLRKKK